MIKSFKQFVAETFDSSHVFRDRGPNSTNTQHKYAFDHGDDTIHVTFTHHPDNDTNVSFTNKYGHYDASNDKGPGAVKVFSTVHKIMQHHAAKYPKTSNYSFNGQTGSRTKLYDKLVNKIGGTTEPFESMKRYNIGAEKLRK